jgi:hypothetical protein
MRFAAIAELLPIKDFSPLKMGGVRVTLRPHLLLRRLTRTNKIRMGALMLRYAKGKPLPETVAGWQSAAIFGFLRTIEEGEAAEAERALCITLCAYKGVAYEAPTNSVYMFNEMKAACAAIAERWPALKPPTNAVIQ